MSDEAYRIRKLILSHAQLGQCLRMVLDGAPDDLLVVGIYQDVPMAVRRELHVYVASDNFELLPQRGEPRTVEAQSIANE